MRAERNDYDPLLVRRAVLRLRGCQRQLPDGVRDIALAFVIGGVAIIASGIISCFLLLPAERRSLESIARPLTAVDPEPSFAPRVPALR